MGKTTLHLRSETKPLEHRSALTPKTTKALVDAGYIVNVERSPVRIFDDDEFEKAGATLVPEGSWPQAPRDHLIVGLKELLEEDFALEHTHVSFAHCFKKQTGWDKVLARYHRGGGLLYDLEFLTDDSGRRIAAFGYHAGYSGAALAVLTWAHQILHPKTPLPSVSSYPNEAALVSDVKQALAAAIPHSKEKRPPRVMVIGALGRCGRGAVDLCKAVGVPDDQVLKWDMQETAKGGPFAEVIESDIFINCIYLSHKIPPFLTSETLASPSRRLSVVCDVSCDPNNEFNPVPIYTEWSTFEHPTLPVKVDDNPPLSVIAIDHLPSLLPREASDAFSTNLLPSLLLLDRRDDPKAAPVWTRARALYNEKVAELPKA